MTKTMLGMPNENIPYIHAFNCTGCVGPKTFQKLFNYFHNDLKRGWHAPHSELLNAGISEETSARIIEKRAVINPEKEFQQLQKQDIEILLPDHFPPLLTEIPFSPALLYLRGAHPRAALPVAVVGTRRPTSYGREATTALCRDLGRAGVAIVSGLALGIDGLAHAAALEAHAPTVAVLGSGVDDASIYPAFHKPLAQKILANGGTLLSEFPPGTRAQKHHFPQRNRIIAGLTRGTVVVEAKKASGALITARFALEYNRDVFAVPGPVFSALSEGPHVLLKEGAIIARSAEDILNEYDIELSPPESRMDSLGDTERAVVALLETQKTFEEIRETLAVDAAVLNSALAVLELNDSIKNLGNQTYIRKNTNF